MVSGMRTRMAPFLALVICLAAGCSRGEDSPTATTPTASRTVDQTGGQSATPSPSEGTEPASRPPKPKVRPEFFGMHASDWTTVSDIPMGSTNLTTSRVYWVQVETSPGTYDFTTLDAQVEATRDLGTRPMLVLGGTPQFHQGPTTKEKARIEPAYYRTAPPERRAWRTYVRTVVERYGDQLDYQIWPEPNIVQNWTGTPAEMAELTVSAARVIHRAAPKAIVVSPAVALRLESQRRWFKKFLAAGGSGSRIGDHVDAIAIDPFPERDGSPEDSLKLIQGAQEMLSEAGIDLPVWNNEINYGVVGGNAPTPVTLPEDKARNYILRTYLLGAHAGLERVYWLGWFSAPGLGIDMLDETGNETSAADAYRTIHSWMSSRSFDGCTTEGPTWTCRLGQASVMWRTHGTAKVPAPEGARVLIDADGNRSKLTGDVDVSQAPVLLRP